MVEINDRNIALLIDSENVSSKYVKFILNELNTYGMVSVRRIYGDWRANNDWSQELLLEYSIQPIQQFNYIKGKNSTDIALVIDAMDILYTNKVDIFCLVTSDSDFTRLAMRLRESHSFVIGMGESKTPTALAKSCNKFIYLDILYADEPKAETNDVSFENGDNSVSITTLEQIKEEVSRILSETEKNEISLGELGSILHKQFPDFDVRNFGYTKFSVMIAEEFPQTKLEPKNNTFYISLKIKVERSVINDEVYNFIQQNGGRVKNLSQIQAYLKNKFKYFDLKDYGFSKISSFLRSVPNVSVENNSVKTTKK